MFCRITTPRNIVLWSLIRISFLELICFLFFAELVLKTSYLYSQYFFYSAVENWAERLHEILKGMCVLKKETWLLWWKLHWMFAQRSLGRHQFLFLWSKWPRAGNLGHSINKCLWETLRWTFKMAAPFGIPTSDMYDFQWLHILGHTCYGHSFPSYIITMQLNLIMLLICVSLRTNAVGHISMCLLVHPCPFFAKCLFQPFVHFCFVKLGILFSSCWIVRVLYIFWTQVFHQICILPVLSSILWLLFILLACYFKSSFQFW